MCAQVNWHDFAFFDPVMYESLRQLIRHAQTGEAETVFAEMELAFAIDLCKEEGAGQVRDEGRLVKPFFLSVSSPLDSRVPGRFVIPEWTCRFRWSCCPAASTCPSLI